MTHKTQDSAGRALRRTTALALLGAASFAVAPGCATDMDEPSSEEVGTSSAAIIGTYNAKFYNLTSSGGLSFVRSWDWSAHWTHVVSLNASDGTPLLFFYSRELGTAKIYRYATDGTITLLSSRTDLQKDWDMVMPSRTTGRGFNLLFYRRTDGTLKAMDVRSTGGFVTAFEQYIPDPTGLDSTHGWDIVVPTRISALGEIIFYHRLVGQAAIYRYDTTEGEYRITAIRNWQKTWDEIESGDLDGDGIDDLALYNQDDGNLKLVYFDSAYNFKSGSQVISADMSHSGRLMIADFGGGARKDVALYQNDGGATFDNGRLRIWTDNTDGTRSLTVNQSSINDGWTHLLPVGLGGAKKGILFYSNQHVIDVKVYAMSCSSCHIFPVWKPGDSTQLTRLANAMRKTYGPAGLAFNVSLGPVGYDDTLSTYVCGESSRSSANDWVDANVPPTTLPITLPLYASSGAAGCSSLDANFVKSSYRSSNAVTGLYESGYGNATEKHYAHEVGHYFGLAHGHVEGATLPLVVTMMLDDGDISTLDTDAEISDGSFHPVYDTPPALEVDYWTFNYGVTQGKLNMCQEGRVETFVNMDSTPVNLTVHPHNVMAYNQCPGSFGEGLARLTRDQIRAVRQSLYSTRKALIGL